MIPDSECVKIMVEILSELKLGTFQIKVATRSTYKCIVLPIVTIYRSTTGGY